MRFLSFLSILMFCLFVKAQTPISISSTDMPAVGDTFHAFTDTLPTGFSIGQKGANRTWDFSNLNPDKQVTTYVVAPSSTSYAADFPNANFALTNDNTGYVFYRNTASALKVEGFANIDPNLGVVSVNFNPIPDQYRFPTTYPGNFSAGSNSSGGSGFQEAKPYNQLPPNIQAQINSAIGQCPNPNATVSQVRVTFTSSYTDTIDAWGKVITPIGTYDALRRKRVEHTHTVIEAETNCLFVTQWIKITDTTGTTTEHSWLSTITKLPLISLGYDNARNIISVTYSATPPPPVAGFTWNNPSGGLVNFTNTSQNSPASYDWDFGDSVHNTTQSPSHVYSANSSYYVCLTVTNASGSDMFCDSVQVTGISLVNHPPIAVRDSAQLVYPNSVQLNVLANDIDPDNDSIILDFIIGPLNGSYTDLGGGLVRYTPNTNFRGIDSFQYVIQDDGSPSLRDTGTVVIRVDGLPYPDFTWSNSGFQVQFVNTSTGYDNVFWDLGDGDTAITNTVVHTYARGSYTVCLTARNSVGESDTCKTVDLIHVGTEAIQKDNIQLSPNPASGEVKIEIENWNLEKIEVLNLNGKVFIMQYPKSNTGKLILDMSSLPSGFYICKLTGLDGKVMVGKVIKE